MTTVRSLPPVVPSADEAGGGPGERLRRLRRRRRLLREQVLAIAVLVIALAATLTVLGLQWLDSGQSGNPGAISAPAINAIGGRT
jgi:hypothetical protein